MSSGGDGLVYRFDAFDLDVARGTLRGPEGDDLVLRPKSFALLRHLVEHPGRLLRRGELLDTLWPGLAVTDDSLTQCVGDVRRALGERAPHVLRTLPRRGYVLTAEVRRESAGSSPAASSPASPGAARRPAPDTAADVASVRRDALVILPLDRPPDAARLADALRTDLIATFSRFEDLRMAASSDAPSGTGYAIRGAVRDAGDHWHVTVRLDAPDGATLWAERRDWAKEGPPELPASVVDLLILRIYRQLDLESFRRASFKLPGERTAREHVLLGRERHGRGTEADTLVAREMFDAAIAADPDYALAYAWQAYTVPRAILYGWGAPGGDEARDLTLRLARHAAQLAPDSPLCLSRLAFALMLHRRWEEAVALARDAPRTGRPSYSATSATCAEVLAHAGFAEEAAEDLRRVLAMEPTRPASLRGVLGRALVLAGRPEEALEELRWCAARLPDYAPCFHSLVVACAETGRMEEARAALGEVERLYPGWVPRNHTGQWYFRREEDLARFERAFALTAGALAEG